MEEEMELSDYINMVKDRWVLAAITFLVVFGLVVVYTMTSKPVYDAKSLVLVSTQDQSVTILGTNLPKPDLETQKQIMLSPIVINSDVYGDSPEAFQITANNIKNSNVIEIDVQGNDAQKTADAANKVIDNYLKYTQTSRTDEASELSAFISDRMKTTELELETLTVRAQYFKNNKNMTEQDQIDYAGVQRQISARTQTYQYLINKQTELDFITLQRSSNAKIMSYATAPEKPIKPNVPLNLAIGLVLAGFASIGMVFLANQMKNEGNGKKKRF